MGQPSSQPVFAFVLFGGPLTGALVRDIRLANELAQRGYRVHVWWAMDRVRCFTLNRDITEHWLCSAVRFGRIAGRHVAPTVQDALGRCLSRFYPERQRHHSLQRRPAIINWLMHGFIDRVCRDVSADRRLIRRFARQLDAAGVTHVLPMLSVLGPFVQAARRQMRRPPQMLITFQGYELYANYARAIGCEPALYRQLRDVVAQSGMPAVAVSEDYAQRIHEELGIPRDSLCAIPPGVPRAERISRDEAMHAFRQDRPNFDPDLPLITFLGRQDAEKGIDLLLYAAASLHRRGVRFQLAICGPTVFGDTYKQTCMTIAENLRCPVQYWKRRIDDKTRAELFTISRCVVYPSIHREPFGMVPVEAMAHGTPVVVPDLGGVARVIDAEGLRGGVHFSAWDSGDLAHQIERLIHDQALWQSLADAAPKVAAYFSVERLADRILLHLRLIDEQRSDADPPQKLVRRELVAVS